MSHEAGNHRLAVLLCIVAAALSSCPGAGIFLDGGAPIVYDDSLASRFLPAAVVCMTVDPAPDVNRAKMIGFVDRIMTDHPETTLILFGETSLGWYLHPDDPAAYQRSVAEVPDGPTYAAMSGEASSHGIYIAYGYVEAADGIVYNSLAVLDRSGNRIANHRKFELSVQDIKSGFTAGVGPTTVSIDGIRCGLLICQDAANAEAMTAYAEDDDLEILLFPMAGVPGEDLRSSHNKWVLVANRCGSESSSYYRGAFGFQDPTGSGIEWMDSEEGYLFHRVGLY